MNDYVLESSRRYRACCPWRWLIRAAEAMEREIARAHGLGSGGVGRLFPGASGLIWRRRGRPVAAPL